MSVCRFPPSLRRPPHGLTLIELMVALAVLAVLGTLSWRGSQQMFQAQTHLDAEFEHWRNVGRALKVVEDSLLQIAAPVSLAGGGRQAALSGGGESAELWMLSMAGGQDLEWNGFRLEDGRWYWVRRAAGGGAGGVPDSERDLLLSGVEAVQWRFFDGRRWHARWPVQDEAGVLTPAAVEVAIELSRGGRVTRLHALR